MEVLYYIKKHKYYVFVFFNLLWIWALLSPNSYYFDDGYRASGGFYNWGGDYRPFADWLYYLLGMGQRFTDLAPLPQIISLVFLYYTYYLYIKNFHYEKITISALLIFLPIIWSPFLLSNLYFRYDAIFMMLALLLTVLAVFDVENKKYFRAVLLVFIACGFYQPAIVGYVCTALFFIYKVEFYSKEDAFKIWIKKSFKYFSIFIIAVIIYYFTIMKFTTSYNNYSATHSQMSIYNISVNIIKSIQEVIIIFKGDTGFIYLFIYLYLLIVNLIFFQRSFSYLGIIIFLITNLIFILSISSVNLLLNTPRFEYRTFIFHGFYVSFLLFSLYKYFEVTKYSKYVIIIPYFISFYFLSIALNISNAQKMQLNFEDYLLIDIANTINQYNLNNQKLFYFVGETYPSNIYIMSDKYPLIKKIVVNPFHLSSKIKKYYPTEFLTFTFNDAEKERKFLEKEKYKFNLLQSKKFYDVYSINNDNKIIIFLKKVEQ